MRKESKVQYIELLIQMVLASHTLVEYVDTYSQKPHEIDRLFSYLQMILLSAASNRHGESSDPPLNLREQCRMLAVPNSNRTS